MSGGVRHEFLLNSETLEAWPAWLLRARGNATARALARAAWCVRRKSDGRFVAAAGAHGQGRRFAWTLPTS